MRDERPTATAVMNASRPARLVVDGATAGATVGATVRSAFAGMTWSRARDLCTSGRVRVDGEVERDPARRLAAGSVVEVDPSAPRLRAGVLPADAIVHVDADVVVVRKPAGVMTVPYEAGDRDTLADMTRAALRRRTRGAGSEAPLAIVHRLDKDTSGLVVFARTHAAKRALDVQFRRHTVERRYLAIANGRVAAQTFDSVIVANRGDGLRGAWGRLPGTKGHPAPPGRRAVTHVRPLETFARATLVECRLETGRQHQIRIHLAEAGHPIVGERVYVRDAEGPLLIAPRPMLHAADLGFVHPRTGGPVRFEDPPPADFVVLLRDLRGGV